ncbi:sigma-70 family RNA polymerase sigma factor [Streptomyces sp. NPDC048349]|uniref:RNA polymerase sigma factor n=1 Tax=Streptomyces sp. NPDC048349 TaxID=3155486 RepID=UPI00342ED947
MVADGDSGDAGLRLEQGVGQRLLDCYPAYMTQAVRHLCKCFPGMSVEQCKDVAQEAFLTTAKKCLERRAAPGRNVMGYLLVAARNLAVDKFRADRLALVGEEELDRLRTRRALRRAEELHVLREVVDPAIQELGDTQYRKVVQLQSSGAADKDIAAELGISLVQVRVQRSKAIRELRRKLHRHIRLGLRGQQRHGDSGAGKRTSGE